MAYNKLKAINIWKDTPYKIKVSLTPHLVDGNNNKAIIICPGGSYFWHAINTEGHMVAEWLNHNSISAFVLNYRVAKFPAFISRYRYIFRGNRYPDPQNDLKQAISIVRSNSEKFGIDGNRLGVMGFSAGGHLAMSAIEFFEKKYRPNFGALIYPVVTMDAECVHKRSRRALLGDDRINDSELKSSLSLERHVPDDCPPIFMVNCKDDPIVKFHNSELLDSALSDKNILHKYIQYKTGGHGFGASEKKGTAECREWRNEFIKWIKNIPL